MLVYMLLVTLFCLSTSIFFDINSFNITENSTVRIDSVSPKLFFSMGK